MSCSCTNMVAIKNSSNEHGMFYRRQWTPHYQGATTAGFSSPGQPHWSPPQCTLCPWAQNPPLSSCPGTQALPELSCRWVCAQPCPLPSWLTAFPGWTTGPCCRLPCVQAWLAAANQVPCVGLGPDSSPWLARWCWEFVSPALVLLRHCGAVPCWAGHGAEVALHSWFIALVGALLLQLTDT